MNKQKIAKEILVAAKELVSEVEEFKFKQEPFAVYENGRPGIDHIYLKFNISGPYDKSQMTDAPAGKMRYSIGVKGQYISDSVNLKWNYGYSTDAKKVENLSAFAKAIQKELEKHVLWKTEQEYEPNQWTAPNGRLKGDKRGKSFPSVVGRIVKAHVAKELAAENLWEKVSAEYGRKMAHKFHTQLLKQASKYADDDRLNQGGELWIPEFMPVMMRAASEELKKMIRTNYR